MTNIPKIQKALYPHIPKIDPNIPLNIYKNILYPFKFLANIPVSLKTLPGPHYQSLSFNMHIQASYPVGLYVLQSSPFIRLCLCYRVIKGHS